MWKYDRLTPSSLKASSLDYIVTISCNQADSRAHIKDCFTIVDQFCLLLIRTATIVSYAMSVSVQALFSFLLGDLVYSQKAMQHIFYFWLTWIVQVITFFFYPK